jgi:hypothetical protein
MVIQVAWPVLGISSGVVDFAGGGYAPPVSQAMRIKTDMLPDGELILALVQVGEDVCAKSTGGCIVLPCGLIKLEHEPPLEELTPMFLPHKAQA